MLLRGKTDVLGGETAAAMFMTRGTEMLHKIKRTNNNSVTKGAVKVTLH
jgi:hypothetical protein